LLQRSIFEQFKIRNIALNDSFIIQNHQHNIQVRIEIDGVDAESFFVNEGVEWVFKICIDEYN